MSREDDDAYFERLNGGGIWDEEPSRPANQRQISPVRNNRNMRQGPATWSWPQSDNDYFGSLNEGGGIWDTTTSTSPQHQPAAQHPIPPAAHAGPANPPQIPPSPAQSDDRYFKKFSVFDQGERFGQDAPTVRIPGSVIDQLAAAGNPTATRVEYDKHGGIRRMSGALDVPNHQRDSNQTRWQDRQNGQDTQQAPTSRGGGWSL